LRTEGKINVSSILDRVERLIHTKHEFIERLISVEEAKSEFEQDGMALVEKYWTPSDHFDLDDEEIGQFIEKRQR